MMTSEHMVKLPSICSVLVAPRHGKKEPGSKRQKKEYNGPVHSLLPGLQQLTYSADPNPAFQVRLASLLVAVSSQISSGACAIVGSPRTRQLQAAPVIAWGACYSLPEDSNGLRRSDNARFHLPRRLAELFGGVRRFDGQVSVLSSS
jgi:hypothetical protein